MPWALAYPDICFSSVELNDIPFSLTLPSICTPLSKRQASALSSVDLHACDCRQ
jgi:hypothetical protein